MKSPSELKGSAEKELARLVDREKLVDIQLSGLSDEYDELNDTWKLVDTKAQITAAASGIFLGGIFALQRSPNLDLSALEKYLLVIALVLLVTSVVCAVVALQMRDVFFPPRGAKQADHFKDLSGTEEFQRGGPGLVERLLRYKQDQIGAWIKVNKDTLTAITLKGNWALASQLFFATGAIFFGAMSFIEFARKTIL